MCINAVLQKKAKNIVALNVREISSFTDYLLICSGATDRQVQAISGAVQEYLKKEGIRPLGVEGEANAEWVLLDYDDVVISVFQESARSFYGLEALWDAPRMEIDENATEIKKLSKDMV
ncbi:MAG: ribosome silencing factor [Deltaproteobacteria bacterium]|nr:ribosome silencing factor [Syntrophaceae bacterium]NLX53043.1 ribosome silencing factor [Deltaproteobacteria bacterium]